MMKSFTIVLMGGVLLLSACSNSEREGADPIRIMTYNIKYDNPSDSLYNWDKRNERVTNLIEFYEPDFLGTQEGLYHQLQDIKSAADSLEWIGVARTDGSKEGEYSAIFYNRERFTLAAGTDSTIWLSKTPARPSKNWDAALPRILTWGKFKDNATQKEFFVFNTHFDHVGDTARTESSKIILHTIEKIAGNAPVILTGDFNFTPAAAPYGILTGQNGLNDSHQMATSHVGPDFTFSGFTVNPDIEPRRIDYIFHSSDFTVLKHGAISDFSNGSYPSDHLPVISDFTINQ